MLSRLYTNKVWRTYTHTNDRITISLDAILLWGDNMCYLTIPLNSPLLLFHKGFPLILHWLVNYLGMVLCNINSKAMDHIMELWKYWFQVPLNQNHLKIQIKHVKSIWYYPLKWQQHFKYLLFHQITFIWTGFPLIPIVTLTSDCKNQQM